MAAVRRNWFTGDEIDNPTMASASDSIAPAKVAPESNGVAAAAQ
jgi:hypothetical protein